MQTYPLRPVVTNNPALCQRYDDHPQSIALTSSCITPEAAARLVRDGAAFEAMIVLKDVPEGTLRQLADGSPIARVLDDGAAVADIHSAIHEVRTSGAGAIDMVRHPAFVFDAG